MRWLSLGKVLKRVWDLKKEIDLFLDMKQNLDFPQLKNNDWISDFAFAVDIMGFMNDLNTKLQGKGLLAFDLYGNIKAFTTKLVLLSNQLRNKQLGHFATLQQVVPTEKSLQKYSSMLTNLHSEFSRRFKDFKLIEDDLLLVSTPFSFDASKAPFQLQMELIDLQCDLLLQEKIKSSPITDFYASLNESAFPNLKSFAQQMIVIFGSMYICEQTFSLMKFNKSKHRSGMTDGHLEAVLSIATTETVPNFTC